MGQESAVPEDELAQKEEKEKKKEKGTKGKLERQALVRQGRGSLSSILCTDRNIHDMMHIMYIQIYT